jgi:PEGA domain
MYRVIAVVGAGLVLAACSTDIKNPFVFEPAKDTVRFESEPPGAEAKTSSGETCRTPCALAMPADKPFTVTFTLTGYQPYTEQIQFTSMGDGTSKLRPNPVLVQLTAAAPPKSKKKVRRKKTTTKPAPKPRPTAAKPAPAAPPPMTPAPQPQATSPWPAAPPPPSR